MKHLENFLSIETESENARVKARVSVSARVKARVSVTARVKARERVSVTARVKALAEQC